MKKYIVLSVNENPEYIFYLPLTVWAWRKFGWEPIVIITGNIYPTLSQLFKPEERPIHFFIDPIEGYSTDTVAQISRLYAASKFPFGYLMTGDIDMIPLSDYWKFDEYYNEKEITVWGHDLTSYEHFPICYISMPGYRWMEIMQITDINVGKMIKRDLDSMPNAKSEDREKKWVVDQDLITDRLNTTPFRKMNVLRGIYHNGYPIGRVDRSAWTLDHKEFIDCHMPRGIYSNHHRMEEMIILLEKIWPNEDFDWFVDYALKFKKLLQ